MTIAQIQALVAAHFGITVTDLLARDRHKSVAFARSIAMALCRLYTRASFPELARAFAGRDHTTIMVACRRVVKLRRTDELARKHVDALIRAIDGKASFDAEERVEGLEMCA